MFHLFHCAYVFITFPSSSTSFCEPTLTGKERVLCVGRIAAEFLSCTAMSVSHPGWWMKRTQVGGSALILDHREASKNKEQCL